MKHVSFRRETVSCKYLTSVIRVDSFFELHCMTYTQLPLAFYIRNKSQAKINIHQSKHVTFHSPSLTLEFYLKKNGRVEFRL
jgi:hypothetical protein